MYSKNNNNFHLKAETPPPLNHNKNHPNSKEIQHKCYYSPYKGYTTLHTNVIHVYNMAEMIVYCNQCRMLIYVYYTYPTTVKSQRFLEESGKSFSGGNL